MTARFSLITATVGAAFVFAVPAWGNQQPVPPDAVERAVTANEVTAKEKMLDARERGLTTNRGTGTLNALDARERAFAAKREAQLSAGTYPDLFERVVAAHQPPREPVVDDRFRIDPTSAPSPIAVSDSGREIDWPQLGFGFGLGIALALGLATAVWAVRTRPLAH